MATEREGKKAYATPQLKDFGKVSDLTQTGFTTLGNDVKGGSVLSQGE